MPLNNMQPSLVLGQYIQAFGQYPVRGEVGEFGGPGYTLGFVRAAGFAFTDAMDTILATGQTLSVSTNQALYSILGTNFGGNGVSTFQLPNLAGRVSVDDEAYAGSLGMIDGNNSFTIARGQLPAYAGGQGQAVSNMQAHLTLKWLVRQGDDGASLAGELVQFAGSFVPQGFLQADGASLRIADYPALYAKLGHTYGGDATTFKLPDMTGRTAIGVNPQNGLDLGETIGSATFTITQANMPAARGGQGVGIDNHGPSLAVGYYIATDGIYPSRDHGLDFEEITVGEIRAFAGEGPGAGWLPLDGRLVNIQDHQALFSLVGVNFGGNGYATFGLPDLRGRAVVGWGQYDGQTYDIGAKTGSSTIILTEADLGLARPVNTAPSSVELDSLGRVEFKDDQAIKVSDLDSPVLTVTLTVTAGVLAAEGEPASSTLTRSLPSAELNAWLQTVVYLPPLADFTGAVLTISTSDGSASDTDTVSIAPAPNAAPVIAAGQSFTASENQTVIGTVDAADAEGDAISYALVTGPGANAHNALVVIDAATGALTFKSAPDFETGPNALTINIIATDAQGKTSAPQTVTINVSDVNEAPRITALGGGAAGSVSMAENIRAVTTLTALDPDAGANLVWSIDGGADAAKFTIDAASGQLSFVEAPDFEQPGGAGGANSYAVNVKVSDGTFFDTQAITITVTDANDQAPRITSADTASTLENIAASTVVHQVTATDADTAGGPLAFTLGGADAGRFTIDASGAIRFKASPDFESPIDADADNDYTLSVTVSDGLNSTSDDLTITVEDANDAPTAVSLSNIAVVAENADTSARTKVADIAVIDDALGTNSLSLDGTDAALFEIDGAGLYLKAGVTLDFETKPTLDVRIVAQDKALGASTPVEKSLSLTMNDVNEAPRITALGGAATATVSIAENTRAVAALTALDQDVGSILTWTIDGGADASKFTIDTSTGELGFVEAPDFERPGAAAGSNIYDVSVKVSDGALSDTQSIRVTVTDKNDAAPKITSPAQASVIEGLAITSPVYTATATDQDTTGEAISFSLSGVDAAQFTINAAGEIRFVATPNYAAPKDVGADNAYDLILTASDGVNSSGQAVVIRVQQQPAPEPEEPQPPTPQPGTGPGFVEAVSDVAGVDLTGDKAQSPTLVLPDGRVVSNPVFEAAQSLAQVQTQLQAGQITADQAIEMIVEISAPTFGVANDAYVFFTGSAPTPEGFTWLIDSPDNPNDLTDLYYAAFSLENRYINFAVNLGKNGEGRSAFEADYGSLTFEQAIAKAYEAVIGGAQAQAAGIDVAAAQAYIASQRPYFDALGGDSLGGKAAMVGYILSLGATFHVGRYYEAMEDQIGEQIGLVGASLPNVDGLAL